MSRSCNRLLIFRLGHLGDTLVALPALVAIRNNFPTATISLLSNLYPSGERIAPDQVLPKGLVDEWITYQSTDAGGRPVEMVQLLLELRRKRFDALVYLAPRIRSSRDIRRDLFFFRLAGISNVIGREGFEPLPREAGKQLPRVVHEADHLLQRLSLSGLNLPAHGHCRVNMDLRINASEQSVADSWLARVAGNGSRPFVGIAPGSKWPSKVWPEDRFVEIGHRLITKDVYPIVFGGAEDKQLGERLIQAWNRGANAAGELPIRLAGAALSRCLLYVGNDTGTMHLAAAVKTKCVAIMSALDWPGHWDPYGPGHIVLRRSVPCEGCLLKVCDTEGMRCLKEVSVDDVWAACQLMLNSLPQTQAVSHA